jgi:hypothetical protein
MVATAGVAELHVPPGTEDVRVEEPFAQIALVPEIIPAIGTAVTVTIAVVDAFAQPPVPVMVYVITDVPALTPVTAPVEGLMVAAAGVPEDQAPPASPLEESTVDPFAQIAVVPEIVPAVGTAVTVTVAVAVAFAQPPEPVIV